MSEGIYDAHNHLQDVRLAPHLEGVLARLDEVELKHAVVNGTREEDWNGVIQVCAKDNRLLPALGLHPWYVRERSTEWKKKLLEMARSGKVRDWRDRIGSVDQRF